MKQAARVSTTPHTRSIAACVGNTHGESNAPKLAVPSRLRSFFVLGALAVGSMSANAGAGSWRQRGPDGSSVHIIAPSPSNPQVIYTGGWGGVFRSTDGARTWQAVNTGLGSPAISDLAVDPTNPMVVFCLTKEEGGLYKSTDGGRNWRRPADLSHILCLNIQIDSIHRNHIYVGTDSFGILESRNGGVSWRAINNGIPFWGELTILRVASDSRTLYAMFGVETDELDQGLFRSDDGGESWSELDEPPMEVADIMIDRSDPDVVYVADYSRGVTKSTDRGATWERLSPDTRHAAWLVAGGSGSDWLYAGLRPGGVVMSTNGGKDWKALNVGLPAGRRDIDRLATSSDGSKLFAACENMIYVNASPRGEWRAAADGLCCQEVDELEFTSGNPSVGFAAGRTLFKTLDGGRSWSAMNRGIQEYVSDLVVDPSDPRLLFVVQKNGDVKKSTDGGSTWSTAMAGLPKYSSVYDLAIGPSRPQTLYAAADSHGIFRSNDRAGHWTRTQLASDHEIVSVAVAPSDHRVVYAGTFENIVFKTEDGGVSWERLAALPGRADEFAVDPMNPDSVFAVTEAGTHRTDDGGITWRRIASPDKTGFRTVTFDPVDSRIAYAASRSLPGLFITTNRGISWRAFDNRGMPLAPVKRIAVLPDSTRIAVATSNGVYTYDRHRGHRAVDSPQTRPRRGNSPESVVVHPRAIAPASRSGG